MAALPTTAMKSRRLTGLPFGRGGTLTHHRNGRVLCVTAKLPGHVRVGVKVGSAPACTALPLYPPSRADVARPRAKFILSLVSQAIPIPLSSQKCLGQLQSLLARENLRPQPPAREII